MPRGFTGEGAGRIAVALASGERVLSDSTPGAIESLTKAGGDPLTAADIAVDDVLRGMLPLSGGGMVVRGDG